MLVLKCPHCGADLTITPDMDVFACGYCGSKQMVRREGGTVSLKLIGEAIARVQVGTDRTAAELAVQRLRDDVFAIQSRIATLDEWLRENQPRREASGCFPRLIAILLIIPFSCISIAWLNAFFPTTGGTGQPDGKPLLIWFASVVAYVVLAILFAPYVYRSFLRMLGRTPSASDLRRYESARREHRNLSEQLLNAQTELDDHLTFLSGPARPATDSHRR